MIFRVEKYGEIDFNNRYYDVDESNAPVIDKDDIDEYIAEKIRYAINGSKNRQILSYSKSLATCLLKYNKFEDNVLHICRTNSDCNYINYISPKGKEKLREYNLAKRINATRSVFKKDGKIELLRFVIDASNNEIVDEYLRCYQDKGMKKRISPEKDAEIVIMNPPNDNPIYNYMSFVYMLYALQMKYNILNVFNIRERLIYDIMEMDDFYFYEHCDNQKTICYLIDFLACYCRMGSDYYERELEKCQQFCKDLNNDNCSILSPFDLLLFDCIISQSYADAKELSYSYDAHGDVLSAKLWDYYCEIDG